MKNYRIRRTWKFVGVSAITLIFLLLFFRQGQESRRAQDSLLRSYLAQKHLQSTYAEIADLESSVRVYVLNGDTLLLDTLQNKVSQIVADNLVLQSDLQYLRGTSLRNKSDSKSGHKLEELMKASVAELQDVQRIWREDGLTAATVRMRIGRDRLLMENMRATVDQMLFENDSMLNVRQLQAQTETSENNILLYVAIALFYLGWIVSLVISNRFEKRGRGTEIKLQDRDVLIHAMMDGGKHGIVITDRDNNITFFNHAAERMYGYKASHFIGRSVLDFVAEVHVRSELEEEAQRLSGESNQWITVEEMFPFAIQRYGIYEREWTAVRQDGAKIPILLTLTTMRSLDGEIYGSMGIFQDISGRKEIERIKNDFISTASHELRTPLTTIRAALGLVAAGSLGNLPVKAKEMLDIAYKNCERLVRIINDILDIEKAESGKLVVHLKALGVRDILHQAVEANKISEAKYGVHLVLKNVPKELRVMADPDCLMQILTNLLSNAAKFSLPGAEIWVKAEPCEDRVCFSVRDFGIGIPKAFQERIFEKFAQADHSDTRQREGTGLGLSIVLRIVEAMHGTIRFETEAGAGTTFFFELPKAADAIPVK